MQTEIQKKLDILIFIPPLIEIEGPLVGPYLLRSTLRERGLSCEVFDANIDFLDSIENPEEVLADTVIFNFMEPRSLAAYSDFKQKILEPFLQNWMQIIRDRSPRVVGFSMLTSWSARVTLDMIGRINNEFPYLKIVLGGPFTQYMFESEDTRKKIPGQYDIIVGEAEKSLPEYLLGNSKFPGINSAGQQLQNLDEITFPDYSGANFERFDKNTGRKTVFITGSRGCVRRCSFCDVGLLWPKYRYRSAKRVVSEIKYLYHTFGRNHFRFTDSLINASIPLMREFCNELVDASRSDGFKVTWAGQAIFHRKQTVRPEDFDLMKAAGVQHLFIGLESGSENVRAHMKKLFSNDDVFYNLSEMHRAKISTTMLMIVGYWNEGEAEFQESLDIMTEFAKRGYFRRDSDGHQTIAGIDWGGSLMIIPNTPLYHEVKAGFVGELPVANWTNELTNRKERLRRVIRAIEHTEKLGFVPVPRLSRKIRSLAAARELKQLE